MHAVRSSSMQNKSLLPFLRGGGGGGGRGGCKSYSMDSLLLSKSLVGLTPGILPSSSDGAKNRKDLQKVSIRRGKKGKQVQLNILLTTILPII
jgi:hypothetical protein